MTRVHAQTPASQPPPGAARDDPRLATLRLVAQISTADLESERVQAEVLREVCTITQAESGLLYLLRAPGASRVTRMLLGEGATWADRSELELQPGLVAECLRTGLPLRYDNASSDAGIRQGFDLPQGLLVDSFLCAPLLAAGWGYGAIAGAIALVNKRGAPFDDLDQALLSLVAGALAAAWERARQVEALKSANADLEIKRQELLRSRDTLRALFDNTPASIYIVDPNYTLIAINMSRSNLTGKPPWQLVGGRCYEGLFGRTTPCPDCMALQTILTGVGTRRLEQRPLDPRPMPGGGIAEIEISTFPIYNEDGEAVQAILFEDDVTEKRRLEASLAQSEKLAAIGQLAAGVAHEINNPLTAIIANAQMLRRSLVPQDADSQEMLDLIVLAGGRASQVVGELLDFARPEPQALAAVDINETLRRSMALLQHELSSRPIQLVFDPTGGLPPVQANADQLQGVWLNLMVNAVDAIGDGPGEIRISSRPQEQAICVSVADDGKGIPADQIPHIFEPFYTTKEPGRGTGLGLSVCHQVVQAHGGEIRVESQPGRGTVFTVLIPFSR